MSFHDQQRAAALLMGGSGGGTYYGNTDTPFDGGDGHIDESFSDHGIFYRIDFGSAISGTITELNVRCRNINNSSNETQWAIYDDNAGEPGTAFWSTGRFTDPDSGPTTYTKTLSESITSTQYVWVGMGFENSPTFGARIYYDTSTGQEVRVVDLDTNEWLNDFADGSAYTDLTNNATAVNYTTRDLEVNIKVE